MTLKIRKMLENGSRVRREYKAKNEEQEGRRQKKQVMLHLRELQAERKAEKERRYESLCRGLGEGEVVSGDSPSREDLLCGFTSNCARRSCSGTQITNPIGGNPGDIFVVIKFPESKGI